MKISCTPAESIKEIPAIIDRVGHVCGVPSTADMGCSVVGFGRSTSTQ